MIKFARQYPLVCVLVLAVIVRLAVLLLLYPSLFAFERTDAIHGSAAYDTYAQNLLASGVYGKTDPGVPDAHLPPLHSYLLAGLYTLAGRSGFAVGMMNIALDVLSITMLYAITRRLLPAMPAVAWLAGLMYAFYPYLIFQNLTLIDTPLFMALLYSWLWTMVLLREAARLDRQTLLLAVVSGILLGLLALVRTNAALLAPLLGLWFLLRLRLLPSLLRLGVVAVVSALTIAPWIAYASSIYGTFVPVALNGGENLYQGNNPLTVPYFRAGYDVQWVPPPSWLPLTDPRMTPERGAALAEAGWQFLRENPQQIPELLWVKFLIHWSIDVAPLRNPTEGELPRLDYRGDVVVGEDEQGNLQLGELPPGDPVGEYSQPLFDQIGRTVHRFYWGGLFLLGLAGIALSWRQWRSVSLLWLVQIAMMAIYVFFHPATRYRAPTDPLWFVFSAYALVYLWSWWRARRPQPAPLPSAAAS
jgi:4-amino-4-deoxy-L-arabinose transferase-like glycosyltransferase